MNLFYKLYAEELRKIFMLLLIALVIFFFTFYFWLAISIFVIGEFLNKLNAPHFVQLLGATLSLGIFFSVIFISLNAKVAKSIAVLQKRNAFKIFVFLQSIFILVSSIMFYLILLLLK